MRALSEDAFVAGGRKARQSAQLHIAPPAGGAPALAGLSPLKNVQWDQVFAISHCSRIRQSVPSSVVELQRARTHDLQWTSNSGIQTPIFLLLEHPILAAIKGSRAVVVL
jgi:hypothetical protein